MYICEKCGALAEEPGQGFSSSSGYYSEDCHCGGTFVPAEKCEVCGEFFVADEMFGIENGHICGDCLYDRNDIDEVYEIASEATESIEINGFLASAFTAQQIEEILLKELRNSDYSEDIRNYISSDELWFAERLKV